MDRKHLPRSAYADSGSTDRHGDGNSHSHRFADSHFNRFAGCHSHTN